MYLYIFKFRSRKGSKQTFYINEELVKCPNLKIESNRRS